MQKLYFVSMEGPDGISAVTFDAENDVQAFVDAARIVGSYIEGFDPTSVIELMRPDATALDTRPTAEWMAQFAKKTAENAKGHGACCRGS